MSRPTVAAVTALGLVVAACGVGAPDPVRLDGSPRYPDDEGIATTITLSEIVIGDRTYGVSSDLRSFSTYTRELEPVRNREGQYVQVGVHDGDVVWLAGIAAVSTGNPPTAVYAGVLVRVDDERLLFDDGTVLTLAQGVTAPVDEGYVIARLDASAGRVVDLRVS